MGISRLTAMLIETNEVKIIDTGERAEAWLMKDNEPHALLLSCPLENRPDMESAIQELKKGNY